MQGILNLMFMMAPSNLLISGTIVWLYGSHHV